MENIKFEELGLNGKILKAVTDMGFEEATPIQAKAIPVQMEGLDMIGQAQTGTGKTAAFGIPLLQKVDARSKKLQAMVLCPTRELAIQVAEEIRSLAKYMNGIKVLPVYGGQDIVRQIRSLKDGAQVIIGTPGRVMDHMRRHTVKPDQVRTVVMDEADEMLNMGFLEDMETILSQLPQERQTILFSATMPDAIMKIARTFQKDPQVIRVVKKELTVPKVTQYYYEVKPRTKVEVMCRLLDMYAPKLSVAFCNTKRQVDALVEELQGRGYFAEGLHGDLKQVQRDRVMNSFRNGRTEILVATDVAARGIDVDDVEAVFNYDIPQDDEYYVHRIGRTGRAGREGIAFSLVVGREAYKLRDIQRYCKTRILPQAIPSLDDVTEIKAEKVLSQAKQMIGELKLDRVAHIVEKKLLEEDYTSLELAAALLRMSMGEESRDIIDDYREARSLEDLDRYGREGRYRGSERNYGRKSWGKGSRDFGYGEENQGARSAKRGRPNRGSGMVTLFLNIGKDQKIKSGDILGAVSGESGMPGKLVGSIDMYDKYTFVEVPEDCADEVLECMKHVKIRGKRVHAERANHGI
ncbi:MAG: DEAD/DEAH box helicase [Lachnospiraceae bacterium]|nr:DEAD/DEAH box helicase [Lachnospiraceae bacterium]